MCTERKATGLFMLTSFLCDNGKQRVPVEFGSQYTVPAKSLDLLKSQTKAWFTFVLSFFYILNFYLENIYMYTNSLPSFMIIRIALYRPTSYSISL